VGGKKLKILSMCAGDTMGKKTNTPSFKKKKKKKTFPVFLWL